MPAIGPRMGGRQALDQPGQEASGLAQPRRLHVAMNAALPAHSPARAAPTSQMHPTVCSTRRGRQGVALSCRRRRCTLPSDGPSRAAQLARLPPASRPSAALAPWLENSIAGGLDTSKRSARSQEHMPAGSAAGTLALAQAASCRLMPLPQPLPPSAQTSTAWLLARPVGPCGRPQ